MTLLIFQSHENLNKYQQYFNFYPTNYFKIKGENELTRHWVNCNIIPIEKDIDTQLRLLRGVSQFLKCAAIRRSLPVVVGTMIIIMMTTMMVLTMLFSNIKAFLNLLILWKKATLLNSYILRPCHQLHTNLHINIAVD